MLTSCARDEVSSKRDNNERRTTQREHQEDHDQNDDDRTKHLEKFIFSRSPDQTLTEVGINQARQMMQTTIAVETYSNRIKCVQLFFYKFI